MSLWQALYDAQDWLIGEYLDDMTYSPQDEKAGRARIAPYGNGSPELWAYVADLRYADEN